VRQLLRRARQLRDKPAADDNVLERLEDLAQLLALWRPGACGKEREQAYLEARFAGLRPSYIDPSLASVLGSTHGQLLYFVMWTISPSARRGGYRCHHRSITFASLERGLR
jgi:hypothetical protein